MDLTIVTIIVGIVVAVVYLFFLSPFSDPLVIRFMDKALDRFFKWVLKTTEEKEACKSSMKEGK